MSTSAATENAPLLERLIRERRRHAHREAALGRELAELRAQLVESERRRCEAEAEALAVPLLRQRIERLQDANRALGEGVGRIWELTRTLADARAEAARFADERDELLNERTALEALVAALPPMPARPGARAASANGVGAAATSVCGMASACATAESSVVAGPRVLCIGAEPGLARLCDGLARRLGMALVHRADDAGGTLDAVDAADVVLYPSHAIDTADSARLREHCDHTGKPCVLYRGHGPAGIAVALSRLSLGDFGARNLN